MEAPANLNYKGTAGAQAIQQANPNAIKNVNQIKAGQNITLPGGTSYQVQKGDTLDKIARRMPVSTDTSATPQTAPGQSVNTSGFQSAAATKPTEIPAAPPTPASTAVDPSVAAGQNIGGQFAKASSDKAAQDSFAQISGMAPTITPAPSTPPSTPPSVPASSSQPQPGLTSATTPQGSYSGGQAAVANPTAGETGVTSTTGSTIKTGSGGNLTSRTFEEELEEELAEMMRLSGLALNEKAVSKQQQKFMGMVHAMHKGEKIKGASPELKKAAKGMSKKSAKDYASTKHKGLPQKVSESVMLEAGSNLEHIVTRFKHETKNFLAGHELDSDLYDALYDYYANAGEMPYGVAKAREGDPFQWVSQHFEDDLAMMGHMRQFQETVMPVMDDTLNELARLAGLSEGPATNPAAQKQATAPGSFLDTAKQGMQDYKDLWMMGATGQTPDRWKTAPERNVAPRRELDKMNECDDMGMEQEDSLNVSTSMSSDGKKNVTISAQGEQAEALMQMLKLAGMGHMGHDSDTKEPVIMVSGDDEMMEDDQFGTKGYIGSKDPRVAAYQEFINKTAKITGSPTIKVDGMFGPETLNASSKTNNFFMHDGRNHPAANEFWSHQSNITQHGIEDMEKGITKPTKGPIDTKVPEDKTTRNTKYSNTPDEEYETVNAITRQGNDLNREKRQYADKPKLGDNPMAEQIVDEELQSLLDSVLVREQDPKRPKGDTGIADIFTADKGIPPPSPDEGPVAKGKPTPAVPNAPTSPGIPRSGMKK